MRPAMSVISPRDARHAAGSRELSFNSSNRRLEQAVRSSGIGCPALPEQRGARSSLRFYLLMHKAVVPFTSDSFLHSFTCFQRHGSV